MGIALQQNCAARHFMLMQVLCVCWLLAKILSVKVWLADRLFPVVPLFEDTAALPHHVHTFFFITSTALMLILLVFPCRRGAAVALFISEILSCILDVTRWHPWEYQYLFFLLVFICYGNNHKKLYSALTFILASTYIFTGLLKFNGGFLYLIWEKMLLYRLLGFNSLITKHWYVHYAGLLIPAIEIAGGLGLVLSRKRWPVCLLMLTHIVILLIIGPAGLNINNAVWPWNVTLLVMLYQLLKKDATGPIEWKHLSGYLSPLLVVCWGILPAFGLFGHWDHYLSSGMYSGRTPRLQICIYDIGQAPQLGRYMHSGHGRCEHQINVQEWAQKELNLPPYPEVWYYRKFAKQWQMRYGKTSARFYVTAYPFKSRTEIRL